VQLRRFDLLFFLNHRIHQNSDYLGMNFDRSGLVSFENLNTTPPYMTPRPFGPRGKNFWPSCFVWDTLYDLPHIRPLVGSRTPKGGRGPIRWRGWHPRGKGKRGMSKGRRNGMQILGVGDTIISAHSLILQRGRGSGYILVSVLGHYIAIYLHFLVLRGCPLTQPQPYPGYEEKSLVACTQPL